MGGGIEFNGLREVSGFLVEVKRRTSKKENEYFKEFVLDPNDKLAAVVEFIHLLNLKIWKTHRLQVNKNTLPFVATVEDYTHNINFEIPTGLAQRQVLFSAIKFVMSNYLSSAELQSIFTILGSAEKLAIQSIDALDEVQNNRISELIEKCDEDEKRLELLIRQLEILYPTIWYEQIWPLVRPQFYLPYKEGFYTQRFKYNTKL